MTTLEQDYSSQVDTIGERRPMLPEFEGTDLCEFNVLYQCLMYFFSIKLSNTDLDVWLETKRKIISRVERSTNWRSNPEIEFALSIKRILSQLRQWGIQPLKITLYPNVSHEFGNFRFFKKVESPIESRPLTDSELTFPCLIYYKSTAANVGHVWFAPDQEYFDLYVQKHTNSDYQDFATIPLECTSETRVEIERAYVVSSRAMLGLAA